MGCCSSSSPIEEPNKGTKVPSSSEMSRPNKASNGTMKQIDENNLKGAHYDKTIDTPTPPEKEPSQSYTPIDLDNQANDARSLRLYEKELKMASKKSEIHEKEQQLKHIKDRALDDQIKQQQSHKFAGLHEIFTQFATSNDKTKMDINGLTEALTVFGMII
eukprot:167814_1